MGIRVAISDFEKCLSQAVGSWDRIRAEEVQGGGGGALKDDSGVEVRGLSSNHRCEKDDSGQEREYQRRARLPGRL